ncbi:SDR family NAD(P)-dependent oxidoreductase [Pedobacter aquae]|uniref:SDR family NAD(P)-dependent oxidoreductase n=1 Tax=Pedobacter aquae TaxID=2605747 RepID=A0A5C0VI14_9SPHI|nr:SDR family NAD(P)-dependent oxidoreductase [Pedobacter aquae]QEK51321.1 SDR family NAD(P)-dependent oxidoreductase [Pedobacter aquae]
MKKILITGGAGFIGSHLCDELIAKGYDVTVYDNLLPQVHGHQAQRPDYLNKKVRLIIGDVRDKDHLKDALQDIDVVFHFAARVGVGQSMYEINEYTDVNNRGTAVLMELLAEKPIQKLIVASSMSIYGEGLYVSENGERHCNISRTKEQLKNGHWEPLDKENQILIPIPTPEDKTPDLASVYALSKYDQEKLCLITGQAYHIPTVALRFFNVYGTRQALSNPYTGVLAIFASRYLNNKAPMIFEDGLQERDFIHVKDVCKACILAMEKPEATHQVFNIGSGHKYNVREIALQMAEALDKAHIMPIINGKYRVGDIRHCFADIQKAKTVLGFTPSVSFKYGLQELAAWLEEQVAIDEVDKATLELETRGLTV